MHPVPTAAVVTVGSELVDGIGIDTNTAEIASALTAWGHRVLEAITVPDDIDVVAEAVSRLTAAHPLVICTGGLGPTHDDITREAASQALGVPLAEHAELRALLAGIADRHPDPRARERVLAQAYVIEGASVLMPVSGTAPGQVIPTAAGRLVLLPGPPHEMRPMLSELLGGEHAPRSRILGCVGVSEADAQLATQAVIAAHPGIELTVLATPGRVRIVLTGRDESDDVDRVATDVAATLGDACYATDGSSLEETVVRHARETGTSLGFAESCTGGMLGAAVTAVPGASEVFTGAVVAYADRVKRDVLGVSQATLDAHGAVSRQTAEEMASAARSRLSCDLAVSVTGVAGPGGATPRAPLGRVWFGIASDGGVASVRRDLFGDREGVRERAVVTALDLIRLDLIGRGPS